MVGWTAEGGVRDLVHQSGVGQGSQRGTDTNVNNREVNGLSGWRRNTHPLSPFQMSCSKPVDVDRHGDQWWSGCVHKVFTLEVKWRKIHQVQPTAAFQLLHMRLLIQGAEPPARSASHTTQAAPQTSLKSPNYAQVFVCEQLLLVFAVVPQPSL